MVPGSDLVVRFIQAGLSQPVVSAGKEDQVAVMRESPDQSRSHLLVIEHVDLA